MLTITSTQLTTFGVAKHRKLSVPTIIGWNRISAVPDARATVLQLRAYNQGRKVIGGIEDEKVIVFKFSCNSGSQLPGI